jgi:hypothetical protein
MGRSCKSETDQMARPRAQALDRGRQEALWRLGARPACGPHLGCRRGPVSRTVDRPGRPKLIAGTTWIKTQGRLGIGPERAIADVRDGVSQSRDMVYGQNPADPKSNTVLELSRMGKDAMLRLTDEELSQVQDLCRVLPPWKRGEFLQELTRRLQGRELNHADLRREAATAMRAVLGRGHVWVPEDD